MRCQHETLAIFRPVTAKLEKKIPVVTTMSQVQIFPGWLNRLAPGIRPHSPGLKGFQSWLLLLPGCC
jgi:hypothetical protein